RIELELSECSFGATRELTVDTAVVCPTCSGEGTASGTHPQTCDICGGVGDGTHIQLAGEGEVGPGGGPPGDLFLEIVQRPHEIFERQGDDLHCTVTIPMVAAAL